MKTLREIWQEKTDEAVAASKRMLAHIPKCRHCMNQALPLDSCPLFKELSQAAGVAQAEGMRAYLAFKADFDSIVEPSPFNDLEDQVWN